MKQRVVQVVDTLDAGGYERVAVDIANGLAQRDVDSFLCTTRRDGALKSEINELVTTFCVERKSTLDVKGIFRFRNWIKMNHIWIVHAHGNSTAMFCSMALVGLPVRVIHHDHNPLIDRRNRFKEILLLRPRVRAWICVSQPILDWATNVIKYPGGILLNNPVVAQRFTSRASTQTTFVKFIQIANFKPHKDHFNLVEAVFLLAKSNTNFVVECVGGNYDSAYREEVDQLIITRGLGKFIKLHTSSNDVAGLLAQSHIGLLSSESEGLPISLLEYLAAGLPVIVTKVGECGPILEKSTAGYLVPPGNHAALAESMKQMMNAQSEWSIFAERGKEYIAVHHAIEPYLTTIENLYRRLNG